MRHKRIERRLLRLLFGVVLAFAILLVWGEALKETRNWRVGRAMNGFRTDPNGEHAHELIQALADKAVTPAQGERILTLLLRPQITTRPAYPAGQPAKMSVGRPLHIEMPQAWIEFQQQVWANGQQIDASRQTDHNVLFGFPEILTAWREPLEPGTYHPEIRIACRIKHPGQSPALWERLRVWLRGRLVGPPVLRSPGGSEPTYECHFIVPFDVSIVERDRAERLELVADPQTDQIMRAAIATETSEQHGVYETTAGRRGYRGGTTITCQRLPLAAAFELSLRLPDGRELPWGAGRQPQHIRLRSGDYGQFIVDVGCFGLTEPGDYAGTLVLRPDPNYAYEDPAIKAIWNGTLEFPLAFSVYVRTQPQ